MIYYHTHTPDAYPPRSSRRRRETGSQLDAMTAARVRVEHERVGRHVRAFRARVKNDEVRVEPLVIGDDDGVDALLMFR